MTKQEYYDLLVKTSAEGGFPSLRDDRERSLNKGSDPSVNCAYRGQNGRKCAFGLLIPDDCYAKTMEGKHAGAVIENFKLQAVVPEGLDKSNLLDIQSIHDSESGYACWNHGQFVTRLNRHHCFGDVNRTVVDD